MLSVCAEATLPTTQGWVQFDVTNHVKDAIRNGLSNVDLLIKYKVEELSSSKANAIDFHSKEYERDISKRPYLSIDGINIASNKDAFVSKYASTTNWGNNVNVMIFDQIGYTARGLITFPLTNIASVFNATLNLYFLNVPSSANKIAQVYKLTCLDWVETEATWNKYKSGSVWTIPGGDYVAEVEDLVPPVAIEAIPSYTPQSKLKLEFSAGDSAPYPMGIYYADKSQYKVGSAGTKIDGRNSIGKYLKDQSFDERCNYPSQAVSTMLESMLSGAGLTKYYVQPNLTQMGMDYAPNKNILDGMEEVLQYLPAWQMREEVDGTVVIGDRTDNYFTQPSRYTFQRDRDIFSREVVTDDRAIYGRVCVHTEDFTVRVYRPVTSDLGWTPPAQKTLYQEVPEGTTSMEAATIANSLAASMANSGKIETFVCAFRPQIISGDEAEILEADKSKTMLGVITQVKHSFGVQGFYTEIVVDSGGRVGKPRFKDIVSAFTPPPATKKN